MNQQQNNNSEIILYTTTDGKVKIDTIFPKRNHLVDPEENG